MECFSAVEFAMGFGENMSFPVIPKSQKVEKIGLGSFKGQRLHKGY